MTNKQRILQMVKRWPEDISFDDAIYHVNVLKKIGAGLNDLDEGRTRDHDELFDDLEQRCDEEETQTAMVAPSRKRSGSTAKENNGTRRAKNGAIVHKPIKKIRKPLA